MTVEKQFRRDMGFTNQEKIKEFYKANDIVCINWEKIELMNKRLKEIFTKLHNAIHTSIRIDDLDAFLINIDIVFNKMKENNIISQLNNNGRTYEEVYYNWMRGFCVAQYFKKAIANLLGVDENAISQIGMDNLDNIETFSKSPMADVEVCLPDNTKIRFELQSGYTGANDIKKHKVVEARNVFQSTGTKSYVIHFDLFNGSAAIVDISKVSDDNINYTINARFEGQIVLSIPNEAFKYRLVDQLPETFQELVVSL